MKLTPATAYTIFCVFALVVFSLMIFAGSDTARIVALAIAGCGFIFALLTLRPEGYINDHTTETCRNCNSTGRRTEVHGVWTEANDFARAAIEALRLHAVDRALAATENPDGFPTVTVDEIERIVDAVLGKREES